jgi:type I restriction enzyme, S subunit
MSELPESWAQVPLAAITSDVTQRVPSDDETIHYIDIGSVNRTTKSIEAPQKLLGKDAPSRARKQVAAGDTVVSMTRPNLNAVALVPSELDGEIASTGFDVLRPVPGVDPRWISYLVRTEKFVDSMSALVKGALYPAVRSKDVRAHVVPLAPAAEQTRIADQLDTLLARIQSCNDRFDAIPALLKRFRQAVLNAATSGTLTEDFAKENPQPWRRVLLDDVAIDFSYGSTAKSARAGTTPVLRMGNIQDGHLDWSDLVYTSDSAEIEKYKLTKGDVLFNRTNSPALVGKTAVYQGERPAIYAGYLIRTRCSSELLPEYLNYCLGSKAGRDYCWSVKSDGVSQSNINAKKLAAFPFALPPVPEQTEIIRRVEALFAFAHCIEARATAARTLAKRLGPLTLAKAFRGELVPQDPQDEPASVLLERVALQRNGPAAKKQSKTPRSVRASRAPKEAATVTKSRQDEDVRGKPYLADHLRRQDSPTTAEVLFKASQLTVADFYKQLAWEVAQGHIEDSGTTLEVPHAAG